ncbi:hypothetical protein [Pseudarthrobacter chlorophenolicus]|nr:hypothetical protein [Pseudarthrobacter chlorophenolicus]
MKFFSKRTTLELALIAVSIILAGLLVFAVIGLLTGSRAADINWGAVADWATAAVTLMGFIGAIAALRVQSAALGLQTQQYNQTEEEKRHKQETEDAEKAAAEKEEKWRCAKAVSIEVGAQRGSQMPGQQPVHKPPLTVICELKAPRGFFLTEVAMAIPDLPAGFRIFEESRTRAARLDGGQSIRWTAQGPYWSPDFGPEHDAKTWLRNHTSVTFKDPDGNTWKLEGTQDLKEVFYVG